MKIEHLNQKYGERAVLQDFSLELPERGTVCLFGPSACGKTTLLNCLAEILKPESGRIAGLSGKRISYVFQESRLLPWATVQENVELVLPAGQTQAALEWISRVGLLPYAGQYPRELSGGQRQRVAIARALAYGGEVLLLDEPFHALDQAAAQKMASLLQQSFPESLKLLVTHNREEAERLSDQIYFLDGPPLRVISRIEKNTQ
ncbi:ABC transporter ATP-binding protein [Faecalispora anaeroviscerum]|uniref:ABC transporter ATP-binding protein n=1 Tax=Faecalispora anaeroviscerum TaxID=2991836 RepID=UPI0024B9C7B9|nr:ATP-binding cassette domain-containing protein [Faecalispora anaeroviscerum]